jgi:hypothetical protein
VAAVQYCVDPQSSFAMLNLPTELLERILALLCHENAQTIQACRQTCRTLNTIVAHSQLVQYLERVALLGVYDQLLHVGGGDTSTSATLALPDHVVALRAWEESWNAFTGGHNDNVGAFCQEREPNLRIALPTSPSARVRYILATIVDPRPPVGPEREEDMQYGLFDAEDNFSFGLWFITGTHTGGEERASYSYLDLHGCLNGVGGAGGGGEGASGGIQRGEEESRDGGTDYDRVHWTRIKVPVRNVVEIALSAELDLAVVISCVFPF